MCSERIPADQIAAWMHGEHETLRALTKVLKEHIAAAPERELDPWLAGLRAGFARLTAHLRRVFAAQEQDGYMEQLLRVRPTLQRRVAQLKCEHGQLLVLAASITRELADIGPHDHLLCADISARIQRFMAVVHQHEQHENTITQLVFNQEDGAGD